VIVTGLKYLIAYSILVATPVGLNYRGGWSFSTPVGAFLVVPLIKILLKTNE